VLQTVTSSQTIHSLLFNKMSNRNLTMYKEAYWTPQTHTRGTRRARLLTGGRSPSCPHLEPPQFFLVFCLLFSKQMIYMYFAFYRFETCWPAIAKEASGVIFVSDATEINIKDLESWFVLNVDIISPSVVLLFYCYLMLSSSC